METIEIKCEKNMSRTKKISTHCVCYKLKVSKLSKIE